MERGARRALGGRLRLDRADADGCRHHRAGAPGDARGRRRGSSSRCSGRTPRPTSTATSGCSRSSPSRTADRAVFRQLVDLPAVIEHLSSSLRRELDFRLEAAQHRAHARGHRRRTRASPCPASTRSCRRHGCSSWRRWSAPRSERHRRATPAGGGEAAPRLVLPPDPDRGLLPRRSAPGEPEVVERQDLLPRLRDGRRGRRRRRESTSCSSSWRSGAATRRSSPT